MTPPAAVRPASHSASIGHYSPGVVVDPARHRLLFVSGQVANDPQGRPVAPGDAEAQTRAVFRNLAAVLAAAGAGLPDVVGMTAYLTSRSHFDAFNRVRNEVFPGEPYPSSTLLIVSGLAIPEHLVEVSAVAAIARR